MHGAVFFLDCNAKRIGFWEVCSPSAAGTHTALSKLRGLARSLIYKCLEKTPKSTNIPSQKAIPDYQGVQKLPYVHGMFLSNTRATPENSYQQIQPPFLENSSRSS